MEKPSAIKHAMQHMRTPLVKGDACGPNRAALPLAVADEAGSVPVGLASDLGSLVPLGRAVAFCPSATLCDT